MPATYNALNLRVSVGDPNNSDAEFSYDDDHNLTVGWLYKYTYDAENRLIEMEPGKEPNELTESERYDNTSPPAETSPDPNYDRRYWYDTAGNPIKRKRGTDPNVPATYNALNLCVSVGDPNNPDADFSYYDCHNPTLDTADRAKLGIATR